TDLASLGFTIKAYCKGYNIRLGFLKYYSAFYFRKAATIYTYNRIVLSTIKYPLTISYTALYYTFYKYTIRLGIKIKFLNNKKAGIILENRLKLITNIIIIADRVGLRSWNIILGFKEIAISSGFTIFYILFPAENILKYLDLPKIPYYLTYTFLPTSASSTTIALKDRYSLAIYLYIAGKDNILLAIKDKFKKDQTFLNIQYIYNNYKEYISFLIKGIPFKNTNGVPRYTIKP
ncbi:unnamed protein product, partial [Clonostachys rhizophaga]